MAIGFLISGQLISHRIETMKNYYSETGFDREIMRIIEPTSEQREKISPIFREFASKNCDLMGNYHENQKELFIDLKKDLTEILNDDQLQRLENHWNKRKRWNEKGKQGKRQMHRKRSK